MIRRQLELFFTALMFYTRLPCPAWVAYSDEKLNQSTSYFPLIGWLVGGVAAGTYWAALWLRLPPTVALLLSMVAGILLTGAFHEDGFADVCDGFGGGWTAERILEIMKDSRLGTYGAAGLALLLALKFAALRELPPAALAPVLLVAHALSRATALTFIFSHEYARANDTGSKAKPVAKKISRRALAVGLGFGVLPLLAYAAWLGSFGPMLVLPLLAGAKWWLARYFQRWIGGYTGDCLGATQQVAEVLIYLFFCAWIST